MNVPKERKRILLLQGLSISAIWVFVLGISGWIIHLIRLSQRLNDVPSASIAISIVAIPVFFTVASVLTYVFVGLQRNRRPRTGDVDAERSS